MSWTGVFKFFVGLLMALGILAGGGLVAARIMIAKLTAPPPRPIYPNDKPLAKTAAKKAPSAVADKSSAATEVASKPLPAGAYEARVTQSIGLVVRDSPSGAQIGGIEYNSRLTVLETSQDGSWQRVRLGNDKEGWVKSGNIEQVSQ
jgi:Bacterial SH3 domain